MIGGGGGPPKSSWRGGGPLKSSLGGGGKWSSMGEVVLQSGRGEGGKVGRWSFKA